MSLRITSLQNPRVKDAAKLRDRHGRVDQGRIIIDGVREIDRASGAGVKLLELFIEPNAVEANAGQRLLATAEKCGAAVYEVSPAVLEKLEFGSRSEGVVAIAAPPMHRLSDLPAAKLPLVAVLEGVEKPGNVGAVLRSADGAGVSAVIVADGGTDLYNPNAIRASLGTIFTLPVVTASAHAAIAWLREHRYQILAARVDGAVDYRQVDYSLPSAIVLGSEAEGLSSIWHADDIQAIQLPMRGTADSLNVSATAAVLFYEAKRGEGLGMRDERK